MKDLVRRESRVAILRGQMVKHEALFEVPYELSCNSSNGKKSKYSHIYYCSCL